jgi:hypothetical protein
MPERTPTGVSMRQLPEAVEDAARRVIFRR